MYYTLLIRDSVNHPWRIEFGSYEKEDVRFEHENTDGLRKNLRIIKTKPDQVSIDAEVLALNANRLRELMRQR